MGTRPDAQGNLHSTSTGEFVNKSNARPSTALVFSGIPHPEPVGEAVDAFGVPVTIESVRDFVWRDPTGSEYAITQMQTYRIASDDPNDDVIAEFSLPDFQVTTTPPYKGQELVEGEAAKAFNKALAAHYRVIREGAPDGSPFADELERKITLCEAAARTVGLSEPEDWSPDWRDGVVGPLPYLLSAGDTRGETFDALAIGLDPKLFDEVTVEADGAAVTTKLERAAITRALDSAAVERGEDPIALLAAEHGIDEAEILNAAADAVHAHCALPNEQFSVTASDDGALRVTAQAPFERDADRESVQAVGQRATRMASMMKFVEQLGVGRLMSHAIEMAIRTSVQQLIRNLIPGGLRH